MHNSITQVFPHCTNSVDFSDVKILNVQDADINEYITTTEHWKGELNEQEQILIEEEIVRFEEEELRDNSDNLEGDLSYNYKHPVQNGT